MARCKMYFLILLPITVCSSNNGDREELVETIGKDADFTPVCSNYTINTIILLVCRIKAERSRVEKCRLLYWHLKGFDQGCDSRFSLVAINQTAFLKLNNLIQENSWNIVCHCTFNGGIYNLNLKVSVEDPTNPTESHLLTAIIGAVIVLTGVILGGLCWSNNQRQTEPLTWTELHTTVIYKEAVVMETDTDLKLFQEVL